MSFNLNVKNSVRERRDALLVMADGEIFAGESCGAEVEVATGELVFNTAMSGYQEILTDPSYAGQIVAFTYPHIGNYGTNIQDYEARFPRCKGMIVRDISDEASSWRSNDSIEQFLLKYEIPALTGIDTRRLTRHLRKHGSMPCAFGTGTEAELRQAAATAQSTDNLDLVSGVSTTQRYLRGSGEFRVVAYDFGVKETMLAQLGSFARVMVVPSSTTSDEILEMEPDGVFLSNGPGDPAALPVQAAQIESLIGQVPIFGICLGHQLLATALGGTTYKLAFGHHGANHPVKNIVSGKVEITSQNHNYAVDQDSIQDAVVTHVNLNDGVVEGIRAVRARAFSVQYHPEAGPGPHDSQYLFREFASIMREVRRPRKSNLEGWEI